MGKEMSEIIKELGLEDLVKTFDEATKKAFEGAKVTSSFAPSPEPTHSDLNKLISTLRESSENIVKENEALKEENQRVRQLAQKVIEHFDEMNNTLAASKKEDWKSKFEECDKKRKELYVENTTLVKQRDAYSKALGTIYGALETLSKELK